MSDRCDVYCHDEIKVNRVQESFAGIDLDWMTTIYKALADTNRLKIAFALASEEEICVCDAANIIGSTLATASHHLRYLKKLGLAGQRREGKLVFYFIKDEAIKQLIINGSKVKAVR